MAIHPVLSIRFLDDDPKIITKRERIVETEVDVEEEMGFFKKASSVIARSAKAFTSFIFKISGLSYDKGEDKKTRKKVEKQSWIIEEDVESRPDKTELQNDLLMVANSLVSDHRQNLLMNRFPPASSPGQYPAYRTGNLARSITRRWRDSSKTIIDVGYKDINGPTGNPAIYSQILADWGRLSLPETAQGMPTQSRMGFEIIWQKDGESN